MKSYVRRLKWLIAIAGLCAACSTVQKAVPGYVSDLPDLESDADLAWRKGLKRTDPRPVVFVVEGEELTCSSDVNGEPGFSCPTVGCRQGCTGSPAAVHIVDIRPRSRGVLCHEMRHVVNIRDGVATMLTTPRTFEGYQQLADRNHRGPEWQPGGEVDKCNKVMQEHGR